MSNEPDSPISEGNPVKEETEKQEGKKGEVEKEEKRKEKWKKRNNGGESPRRISNEEGRWRFVSLQVMRCMPNRKARVW